MKKIELTYGQVALVDDEDYDWLMRWKWRAEWRNDTQSFCAVRNELDIVTKERRNISMQRQILGLKRHDGKKGFHKNRTALDNRRSNLVIRAQLPTTGNKKICGIYKITSPKNKIYIGQAIDCNKRKNHYQEAHCEKQLRLYNSIKKYGWDKHKFEVIEECNKEQLDEREIYYIKFFNCFNTKHGLNLKSGGQFGSPVIKWTKEACIKSAKSFNYISHWKKAHSAAYYKSLREGWHSKCCAHMQKKLHKYDSKSYEDILAHVKFLKERDGLKRRRDWRDKDEASYDYAVKVGFKDRIVKELNLSHLNMRTDYELITIGKRYNSPREWEINDRSSFRVAEKKKLKDAFKHMSDFKGFTDKGYVIKIRLYSIDDSFSLE